MVTLSADDAAFIDEMRAYLAERGLAVLAADELATLRATQRKPRAARAGEARRADGCVPVKVSASKHQRCAAHWRVPGMAKPVCVAPSVDDETGQAIGPAWSDTETVLAFAVDCGARVGDAGRVLKAAREYAAGERHAEHVEHAAAYAKQGFRVPYTGAPDCAACWHEYHPTDAEERVA